MTFEELVSADIKELENKVLEEEELEKLMENFEFWGLDDGKLVTNFEMSNFEEALRLVNLVGDIAEREGHHPDITLYDYKNVLVTFFTHDVDGITLKDLAMAAKIENEFNEKTESIEK